MKQKLRMIWRILRDRQVIVITEDHGRMYCDWDTRSLEDVCQMCRKVHNIALAMDKLRYIPGDLVYQKDDEGYWNIRSLSALNLALINYKNIKPIPLTSEILEKNGWRKTKIYYKLDLNNYQEVWAIEKYDYTYDILVGFKKDDILSTIKEGLKYVSELQNILFGLDLNHEMRV